MIYLPATFEQVGCLSDLSGMSDLCNGMSVAPLHKPGRDVIQGLQILTGWLRQWFSSLVVHWDHLGSFKNHWCLVPFAGILTWWVWDVALCVSFMALVHTGWARQPLPGDHGPGVREHLLLYLVAQVRQWLFAIATPWVSSLSLLASQPLHCTCN